MRLKVISSIAATLKKRRELTIVLCNRAQDDHFSIASDRCKDSDYSEAKGGRYVDLIRAALGIHEVCSDTWRRVSKRLCLRTVGSAVERHFEFRQYAPIPRRKRRKDRRREPSQMFKADAVPLRGVGEAHSLFPIIAIFSESGLAGVLRVFDDLSK